MPEYDIVQDKVHAAHLLSEKLMMYRNSNAIVLAVPRRGVEVGYHLANLLNIQLDIIPCRKIKHPAYNHKSIGSVSLDDASVEEDGRNIPQDYIYHQIILLQHALRADSDYYQDGKPPTDLQGRTVIIVDDSIQSGNTMLTCLKTVRKQKPERIITAVPVTTPEGVFLISKAVDDIVFLQVDKGNQFQQYFSLITDEEVKELLNLHVTNR